MSTNLQAKHQLSPVPDAKGYRFAIVVSEWNKDITRKLLSGAVDALKKAHCLKDDIIVKWVPGTLELPMGALTCCDNLEIDAVIALGSVIRGETPHFDYVCRGAFDGLMRVQIDEGIPITFGILTTEDYQQAKDRAGGKLGNKGAEAAEAAIKMVDLQYEMEEENDDNFELPEFDIDDKKMS